MSQDASKTDDQRSPVGVDIEGDDAVVTIRPRELGHPLKRRTLMVAWAAFAVESAVIGLTAPFWAMGESGAMSQAQIYGGAILILVGLVVTCTLTVRIARGTETWSSRIVVVICGMAAELVPVGLAFVFLYE